MCNWSHQAQGRDITFIMGHALLKKAILHLKRANMPFFLSKNGKKYIAHDFQLLRPSIKPSYNVSKNAFSMFIQMEKSIEFN